MIDSPDNTSQRQRETLKTTKGGSGWVCCFFSSFWRYKSGIRVGLWDRQGNLLFYEKKSLPSFSQSHAIGTQKDWGWNAKNAKQCDFLPMSLLRGIASCCPTNSGQVTNDSNSSNCVQRNYGNVQICAVEKRKSLSTRGELCCIVVASCFDAAEKARRYTTGGAQGK